MEHYDVIIIGAGLAGLHCARLLGRRWLRVLLADRKESLNLSIHTVTDRDVKDAITLLSNDWEEMR